jgi:hypothetical protein
MTKPRRSYTSTKRLLTTIKVAALIAALGFVVVMLEQPQLTASTTHPATSLVQPSSSQDGATYFPGQFGPPAGEIESQPPTF